MGLKEWWKRQWQKSLELKPDCVSSSICVAMAAHKAGYEVRIICKAYRRDDPDLPDMNHAEAQVWIDGEWEWVRMQNYPFDIGIEEYSDKPNIQWWTLEDFFANFIEHEKRKGK